MALIGKIRNNPLIVLLFIGGGILLFILSEMTSSASGPIGPVMNRMGAVGETEIDRNDFERVVSTAFSGGDALQNRDQLWQFYVNEAIVNNEARDLGLAVTDDELAELEFGQNPSPIVRRNMTDPRTGQLNRQLLTQIRDDIEGGTLDDAIKEGRLTPNFRGIWRYQRREVKATRLQEKLNALVTKAMYAPEWLAGDYANDMLANRKVAVVKIPFEEAGAVTPTDADFQAYIDENRGALTSDEETRTISYVTFPVEPTEEDLAGIRETLGELADEWRKSETETADSLFALGNNGSYQAAYVTAERLAPEVADRVMSELSVGDVYGPYEEGEALKLLKVIDRRVIADSASTRHILRNASTPAQFEEADRLVDSLMNVLQRNRRKFTALAEEFNQDPGTASTGGVYEKVTPGQFVRPFDDVLFRTGDIGKLYKVRTQFGVHLVEVLSRSRTSQPRAKVAYIVEPIVPSVETERNVRAAADDFIRANPTAAQMKEAAAAAGLEVKTSNPLRVSAYRFGELGSGQDVRDMMCWAYGAEPGEVSADVYGFLEPTLNYQSDFVVAALEDVVPAGAPKVSALKTTLATPVENRVKGQQLAGKISGSDLAAIATQYGVEVDTISSNPTLRSLPGGVGAEPKVVAAAAALPTGTVSKPIVGNTGVFVIKPVSDAPTGASGAAPVARVQIQQTARSVAAQSLLPGLRAVAEVEDERSAQDCLN